MTKCPTGVTSLLHARQNTLVEANAGERILRVQVVAQSLPGKILRQMWDHRSPAECPAVWRE